jgi:hypothetical protein
MLKDADADVDVELRFVASRGLCQHHAMRLMDRSDEAMSIAQLYRAVLDNVLSSIQSEGEVLDHALQRRWPNSDRQKYLAAMLNPHRACPACEQEDASSHAALAELRQHLFDMEFVEAFQSSAGLCLPHFRQALTLVREEAAAYRLIDLQRAHFQRVRDQLLTFRHAEVTDASWRRAIGIVSGEIAVR